MKDIGNAVIGSDLSQVKSGYSVSHDLPKGRVEAGRCQAKGSGQGQCCTGSGWL